MTATILSGHDIAQQIIAQELKPRVEKLNKKSIQPKLVVLMVGDNPASKSYVAQKEKFATQAGILSEVKHFTDDISEADLLAEIETLNTDNSVHGMIVQLPISEHISVPKVLNTIRPEKDVDGFSVTQVGKLFLREPGLRSATPQGIMKLLQHGGIEIHGKNAVVIGRSDHVGKPTAMLLLEQNATITICHRHTQNLSEYTKLADILVVAVGKPKFITADMVKPGAVVVDVGINRTEDGKLCGDVDFEAVKEVASVITPVPGGVGPMTVVSLIENTIQAAEDQI